MELIEKIELMRVTAAQIQIELEGIEKNSNRLHDMKTGIVKYYNVFATRGELERDIKLLETENDILQKLVNEKIKQLETLKF